MFATGSAAVRGQLAVVVVDLFDAQRSSRDVIEAWVDVVVDHALVTVGGARTELWTSVWIPRLDRNLPNVNGDVGASGGT